MLLMLLTLPAGALAVSGNESIRRPDGTTLTTNIRPASLIKKCSVLAAEGREFIVRANDEES